MITVSSPANKAGRKGNGNRGAYRGREPEQGFTLIEFAIFLLVTGLILGIAAGAWSVLVQGRQAAAAKNILNTVNSCLLDYALLAKKIPTSQYYLANCEKIDPWGGSIRFVSWSQGRKLDCSAATPGIFSLQAGPGDVKPAAVWLAVSAGPDKTFNYSPGHSMVDLSSGDDIYVFVSDMEIHKETCN